MDFNKILITGGSGFIGTNLIEEMLRLNKDVLNLDFSKPRNSFQTSVWRNIDIRDVASVRQTVQEFKPDVVVHLAAATDLKGGNLEYYAANSIGVKNLISVCQQTSSVQRVIFTSSMYVCKPGYVPTSANDFMPHTIYGQSKVLGEQLVRETYAEEFDWCIIRPTSIWGPWFDIPYVDFFNTVYSRRYFDFGRACTKTYGYVGNTVYQICKLLEAEDINGKTFYLGDNPATQISEWANEISKSMSKGEIRKIPYPLLKGTAYVGDILGKLKVRFPITSFRLRNMTTDNIVPLDDIYEVAGHPPYSRAEGVRETIKWLVDYKGYKIKQQQLFKH